MAIKVAKFLDVSEGIQAGQFQVGDHDAVDSLDTLDPVYKQLIDEPVTAVVAVIGSTGRANLTPVWFDYEGDTVLLTWRRTARRSTGCGRARRRRSCS